jgi:ubiquinone/menaquinone biosynthesis C-methylase UbiE
VSDAASFYTGLVAELYGPLKSSSQDAAPYAAFIRAHGEPALELGCGDGEPLLALVAMGLDVEGLDSSMDMLNRCAARAAGRGLHVVLHHGSMAEVVLERRYRSIFLAGATFNLLPDDETARAALERIRSHLAEGGAALIPLFIPPPTPPEVLGRFRETMAEDGVLLRFAPLSEVRDEDTRTQTTLLRYERVVHGETEAVERPWLLHWHTQDGFRSLAAAAGLTVESVVDFAGEPAEPDAQAFVFTLTAG